VPPRARLDVAAPIEVRIDCHVELAREAERYACCRIIMNAAMSATMTATMGLRVNPGHHAAWTGPRKSRAQPVHQPRAAGPLEQ